MSLSQGHEDDGEEVTVKGEEIDGYGEDDEPWEIRGAVVALITGETLAAALLQSRLLVAAIPLFQGDKPSEYCNVAWGIHDRAAGHQGPAHRYSAQDAGRTGMRQRGQDSLILATAFYLLCERAGASHKSACVSEPGPGLQVPSAPADKSAGRAPFDEHTFFALWQRLTVALSQMHVRTHRHPHTSAT